MSTQRAYKRFLTVVLAAALSGMLVPSVSVAAPSSGIAAQRAEVDRAVAAYESASTRLASINARIAKSSAKLDTLVAAQSSAQSRLGVRAAAMYRHGPVSFIAVIANAESFEGFSARWTILTRINRDEAKAISDLKLARKKVGRSANSLLALQHDAAVQLRKMESAAAKARRELADSQAAYADYQRRVAAVQTKAEARTKSQTRPPVPEKKIAAQGTGAWSTGVASHYGLNFSGRGASGSRIGPTSMIVAHKTLPFGTLIEFRYDNRIAVARVADRGPRSKARMFDLGPGVIRVLGFSGVHEVEYRIIGR